MNKIFPVWFYFGGQIYQDKTKGVSYLGAKPISAWIPRDSRRCQLLDKIFQITQWDRGTCDVKIVARYLVGRGDCRYFMPVNIDDDESLAAMIESCASPDAMWAGLELYLEQSELPVAHPPGGSSNPQVRTGSTSSVGSNPPSTSTLKVLHSNSQNQNCDLRGEEQASPSQHVECHDVRPTHNVELMQEIVENDGVAMNNKLVDQSEDEHMDALNEGDANKTNPKRMKFLSAPAPEFESIDWIDRAIVYHYESETSKECYGDDLYVGQLFASKDELQHAVKMYSIKNHRKFAVVKSGTKVYSIKCSFAPDCKWSLHASIPKGKSYFAVKKLHEPHTCVNPPSDQDPAKIDSKFFSGLIVDMVKAQVEITPREIVEHVKLVYNYEISYKKAWHAKQKAIEMFNGQPAALQPLDKKTPEQCVGVGEDIPVSQPTHVNTAQDEGSTEEADNAAEGVEEL